MIFYCEIWRKKTKTYLGRPLIIFEKSSITDISQGRKYVSNWETRAMHQTFSRLSKHEKINFMNLFGAYSEFLCRQILKVATEVPYKKGIHKKFRNIHRKTPASESSGSFTKVACLRQRPATLLIRRLLHRCFPVNFARILRKPF